MSDWADNMVYPEHVPGPGEVIDLLDSEDDEECPHCAAVEQGSVAFDVKHTCLGFSSGHDGWPDDLDPVFLGKIPTPHNMTVWWVYRLAQLAVLNLNKEQHILRVRDNQGEYPDDIYIQGTMARDAWELFNEASKHPDSFLSDEGELVLPDMVHNPLVLAMSLRVGNCFNSRNEAAMVSIERLIRTYYINRVIDTTDDDDDETSADTTSD